MTDLTVAVVIVSYRSAALAIESLRSVQAERAAAGLAIRAVVVDNASGDFPQIARAVAQNGWGSWVTTVLAPRNGGFAYGNNLGVRHALQGGPVDYLYLLNPDTQVRPGAIATLVRFLESEPRIGIAGSSFENADGSEWPIAFRFPSLLSELSQALGFGPLIRLLDRWAVARHMSQTTPQQVDWICGAAMMIRATVLEAIGGVDEGYFLYFEETDLCLRARRAGFPTWYVPQSRVMHVGGQSTGVTERNTAPKRLPAYWFDSRRRYFTKAFGMAHTLAIDLTVLAAYPLGSLKRLALGQREQSVPHYYRDFLRASVLRPRNRTCEGHDDPPRSPHRAHDG
ncbi:MAG TPA: glycosyltransferase family 2 protein [Steroidobacteraceae bacterium]|nr:glycosyltransferase family 2 protein [Steroidobacteraceae bacterium]